MHCILIVEINDSILFIYFLIIQQWKKSKSECVYNISSWVHIHRQCKSNTYSLIFGAPSTQQGVGVEMVFFFFFFKQFMNSEFY